MTDIYESLQKRLDMFPQGFPKTDSGVELDILRQLFSPQEAEIVHHLRPLPEPAETVAARMGWDEKSMGEALYRMSKKGLILRATIEDQTFYLMAPYIVGIWEFQLNNLTPDNIPLYEKYFQEGIVPERKRSTTPGFRVIPIEKEIGNGGEVQSFEKASEIIESNSRFAVADCICRKEARIMEHGCDKILEACMTFGFAANYYIENGLGREITKEEARDVLRKAEEDGLVHHTSNYKDQVNFICNCCGCCCKALAIYTKHDHRASIAKANYFAVVDGDNCSGCETCLDRCQVNAIRMENDQALVDKDTCIGCALCVSTCPTESITLALRSQEERSVVFENQMEFLQTVGRNKNKTYPFE